MRTSNEFVLKLIKPAEQAARNTADPQLLFDYRCYLPGGREHMGTEYPPEIQQCLKRIAGMTVKEVQKHYDIIDELPAFNLRTRAKGGSFNAD